ncbi:aldolase/citrate lyase family protein [Ideonella sp. DXS29W]|uniref:Aldolase/citrate lyase family protein n=1 Tax=Ideonella lacteola TaxID=2984193 RepID=A0ABU9BRT7_9BURK
MTRPDLVHPRYALFDAGELPPDLPVCDHYAGVEARMRKSLELQADLGPAFDVTLDIEDGAPVGGEVEHAHLVAELLLGPANHFDRVGVRLPASTHPAFGEVARVIVQRTGARAAYLMLPKVDSLSELQAAADEIDRLSQQAGLARRIPLHAMVETHGGLREVEALAAHPRVESLSFGLMDFVSAHRGAIPQSAMSAQGQFEHPLVVRAKLAIAAACHGRAKVPSHCVVTEFKDTDALQAAAERACRQLGYTRMWSIHPDQIRPIIDAFSPSAAEVDQAIEIINAARAANWAPIRHGHRGREQLHDRASYRYFWHVLQRAHRTSFAGGPQLPAEVRLEFFGS